MEWNGPMVGYQMEERTWSSMRIPSYGGHKGENLVGPRIIVQGNINSSIEWTRLHRV